MGPQYHPLFLKAVVDKAKDLARYQMAVAMMVSRGVGAGGSGGRLTSQAVSEAANATDQSVNRKWGEFFEQYKVSKQPTCRSYRDSTAVPHRASVLLLHVWWMQRRDGAKLQGSGMVRVSLNSLGLGNCTITWDYRRGRWKMKN